MSKQSIVEEAKEYTEQKLDLLNEWLNASEEDRYLIEEELAVEFNLDLDDPR